MKTLIFLISFLNTLALAESSMIQAMKEQQLIETGHQAFLNRCSGCHGQAADGNGPASVMLNPKPRNLVSGSFKFHSTSSGVLPNVEDLMKTLNQGVIGTSMPSFREVSEQERLAIVMYVRSLRPDFKETLADQIPLNIPRPPKDIFSNKTGLLGAAKKGRAHYVKACILCHGEKGMGNGPSAAELTDADNQPIKPANLRLPYIKSGKTPQDLFKAITVGLDGSPMPGFETLFSEAQRWELVAYVYYLRGVEAGIYNEGDKIE
ncbi:MAG: c-type cytochrome [Deltaproteobacteria bacterium]|nr:c-type cytochrome [Deltaproteobacteria bacterium]